MNVREDDDDDDDYDDDDIEKLSPILDGIYYISDSNDDFVEIDDDEKLYVKINETEVFSVCITGK